MGDKRGAKLPMIGRKFNRLLVISLHCRTDRRQYMWHCLCACGKYAVVNGYALRKGKTQSCGCLCTERAIAASTTHGMTATRPYSIWQGIKERCYSETCAQYPDYGGRGIVMQDSWKSSFETFWEEMSPEYEDFLTIERIDPNKNYSKDNCRWATMQEQGRNRRKRKDNTSGLTGIYLKDATGWNGRYVNQKGERKQRTFSINKYGEQEAKVLATAFRLEGIADEKENGIAYGEQHGL